MAIHNGAAQNWTPKPTLAEEAAEINYNMFHKPLELVNSDFIGAIDIYIKDISAERCSEYIHRIVQLRSILQQMPATATCVLIDYPMESKEVTYQFKHVITMLEITMKELEDERKMCKGVMIFCNKLWEYYAPKNDPCT